MSALAVAFRSAWYLSNQISQLRIDIMEQNQELAEKLDKRIRDVERDRWSSPNRRQTNYYPHDKES